MPSPRRQFPFWEDVPDVQTKVLLGGLKEFGKLRLGEPDVAVDLAQCDLVIAVFSDVEEDLSGHQALSSIRYASISRSSLASSSSFAAPTYENFHSNLQASYTAAEIYRSPYGGVYLMR
jgi:hypothetical protein